MKQGWLFAVLLASSLALQAEPGQGNAYGKHKQTPPGHAKGQAVAQDTGRGSAEYEAAEQRAEAGVDWRVYNRYGEVLTASQLANAVAVEAAVSQAGVDPYSPEAVAIRISMGQSPERAQRPNDGAFDRRGEALSQRQASERFAAVAVMQRAGIDPDSAQAAQVRAAAEGRIETADGEVVDQQTVEEVAKEIAVQEAMIYTGTQPGSADESLIRLGSDVLMEKLKNWWQ